MRIAIQYWFTKKFNRKPQNYPQISILGVRPKYKIMIYLSNIRKIFRQLVSIWIILRYGKNWNSIVVHRRRITDGIPSWIALYLISGKLKNKLKDVENTTICLIHNYNEPQIAEKSIAFTGLKKFNLYKPIEKRGKPWAHTQKVTYLLNYLKSEKLNSDYILYVDSNDVIIRDDPDKLPDILDEEQCDALFTITSGAAGYSRMPEATRWMNTYTAKNGFDRVYPNMGVFGGKASTLVEVFEKMSDYITDNDIPAAELKPYYRNGTLTHELPHFPMGLGCDQTILVCIFRHFYPRIKLDFNARLAPFRGPGLSRKHGHG